MKENIKIKIEDLNLFYGDFHALKNINLDVEENKITALIGPSGCGKSSFLKTINRMNDLVDNSRVKGKILVGKQDIYNDSTDLIQLRKDIGMVFQKPNPFPMSIYDNVAYGPKAHGVKRKDELDFIVKESLKKAALWDEVKDRLKNSAIGISGGQQQRLCIARTLAVEPKIILMDESTSALDPIATLKIEELISEIKDKYTIVIVTHSMQQAGRVADDTAFFLMGEVIESGDTSTIFSKPRDKRTEDYITGRFG